MAAPAAELCKLQLTQKKWDNPDQNIHFNDMANEKFLKEFEHKQIPSLSLDIHFWLEKPEAE